jgi:uncharacterized protein (DUF2384 family)
MEINEVFQKELKLKVETDKLREETSARELIDKLRYVYSIKDPDIFNALGVSQKTFYRRLKMNNWSLEELYILNNVKFYRDSNGYLKHTV